MFVFQINAVLLNFQFITESWKGTNQYISMISERSCDTEDWSNDAENSDLHHKIHFKIYSNIKTGILCSKMCLNFRSNKCIHGEEKQYIYIYKYI